VKDVIKPLNDVILSGFITQGSQVENFKEKLKEYFSNQNILTLNSATSWFNFGIKIINK